MSGQEAKCDPAHAEHIEAIYRGGLVAPPLPKPRFVFTNTPLVLRSISGTEPGVSHAPLFRLYLCPDQCPMHMANLGMALRKLPSCVADRVKLVFVTTDPARDTSVQLRRWLTFRQALCRTHANFVVAYTKDNLGHVIYRGGVTEDY